MNIDAFFDNLKAMRGITELDKHLLQMLTTMQPDIPESAQKFLYLCFSLWNDGNTCVSLNAKDFSKKWFEKWEFLKNLKKSLEESFDMGASDFDDFNKIITEGTAFLTSAPHKIAVTKSPSEKTSDEEVIPPLVISRADGESPCLYMAKHFKAKGIIEESMRRIFKDGKANLPSKKEIDECIGQIAALAKLPNGVPLKLNEEQATAVVRGQSENLLITGGPGTGKTTVVLYILWNLLEKNPEMLDYTFYLAAPSGKAADRMQESLQKGLKGILDEFKYETTEAGGKTETGAYKKLKNLEGSTIHRLLKYSRYNNGFSYNAKEPFSEKSVFVIDEASMIDINLFASLLQAIPEKARVFILGDPYQLPSVDAGAVLGELLKSKSDKNFSVQLIQSNRFTDDSVIGKLAKEIKECAEKRTPLAPRSFSLHPALSKAAVTLDSTAKDSVDYYTLHVDEPANTGKKTTRKAEEENVEKVLKLWVGAFANLPMLASRIDPNNLDPEKCNEIWNLSLTQRILTAERHGIYGIEQINKTICKLIGGNYKGAPYFPGQLLIITQNQEMYKLYNGDTGIVIFDENIPYILLKKSLQKSSDNSVDFVAYPLSLLPADAVESAFAITIHKSQGSEYDHVTVFLPNQIGHPLLNNQIVYTGITRAKKSVTIVATPETFKAACETVIERDTGILL